MDFLKKEFVGLPIWAWMIAGAVTIGAIVYFVRKSGGSVAPGASTGQPGNVVPVPFSVSNQNGPTTTPSTQQVSKFQILTKNPDFTAPADWPKGVLPLYGRKGKPGSGDVMLIPDNEQLAVVGPIGPYGIPVNYLGLQYLAAPDEWLVGAGPLPPTYEQNTTDTNAGQPIQTPSQAAASALGQTVSAA